MWIIRNLRCNYLQNTITNREKIFVINIDCVVDIVNRLKKTITNVIKVFRRGFLAPIGNYEYLHILPQPSESKALGWQRFVITLLML